jgi:hypothetical protein
MRHKEKSEKEFRRQHEECRGKMSLGVNMPPMTQAEMRKANVGLAGLFETEINFIMKEFKPRTDD